MIRPAALVLSGFVLWPAAVVAAPVLRSAEARIEFRSPTACRVELVVQVEGAAEVEHRLEIAEGGRVDLVAARGATQVGELRDVGRTRALVLRPEASAYTLQYTAEQPPDRAGRCPLWIPTIATDGGPQTVRLEVRLPPGAAAVGTMPAFVWTGEVGTATLGHLPAFVRVPYAVPGTPPPWNIARVMDVIAVATLVGASLVWARRRPRCLAP